MNILELYSGIGGMHMAFTLSKLEGTIKASIDINQTANTVYKHNFPNIPLHNRNIQGLNASFINGLNVDTILMSPPCQPFTRNGLQKDTSDPRTNSFSHILQLLPELHIDRLLIENVKGFETSDMHKQLIQTLTDCGFVHKEFILSPNEFGVPNSRTRYYCVAKKGVEFIRDGPVLAKDACFQIANVLDENSDEEEYRIPLKQLLKRYKILDIVYKTSTRSCCFTKSYGRYIEGTGSVFTDRTPMDVDEVYAQLDHTADDRFVEELLKQLRLRFFSPREVCRLMSFPETFTFPDSVSRKQCYMLLGNSINCKVVSELIKLLV